MPGELRIFHSLPKGVLKPDRVRNVPEQMLMRWLGHKNSDMAKHYYHADRQVAINMINQIPFLGDDDAT
ncbi:MAG: hypothetical protein HKN91_03635 [Acidimicrobiia bacterium]|nr:hypothetical protein [Acidimicrobiia bacterium]